MVSRLLRGPLVRAALLALLPLPFLAVHLWVDHALPTTLIPSRAAFLRDMELAAGMVLFLALYKAMIRRLEERPVSELGPRHASLEFTLGFVLSFAIVAAMVALLATVGSYHVQGVGPFWMLPHAFLRFMGGALMQRFYFTLILFRLVEEYTGSWGAMGLVAVLFGGMHLGYDHASLHSTLSLVVSDGLLFGAAWLLTRRLWLIWGLHAGWNFAQDGVFGMANSGITELPSWIHPLVHGPRWLTGGAWGIEASPFTMIANLLLGFILLAYVLKHHRWIAPSWKRTEGSPS